jgi:hypothetical protein
MAFKPKTSRKKIYLAIILLAVLIVASGALIYSALSAPPYKPSVPGVHVGDTFTYSIRGVSMLNGADAVEPAGFGQYNQTDYYKVIITDVNGSTVSLDSIWRFTNGTERNYQQTINLSDDVQSNPDTGFWAIYASNLKVNDPIHPVPKTSGGTTDGLIVNGTDTKTYSDSARQRNYWSLQNEFFDVNDPTYSTYRREITNVYFDTTTGMLVTLSNVQQYNNPSMNLVITWNLVSTSVWTV